jgi:hypothetical protein
MEGKSRNLTTKDTKEHEEIAKIAEIEKAMAIADRRFEMY